MEQSYESFGRRRGNKESKKRAINKEKRTINAKRQEELERKKTVKSRDVNRSRRFVDYGAVARDIFTENLEALQRRESDHFQGCNTCRSWIYCALAKSLEKEIGCPPYGSIEVQKPFCEVNAQLEREWKALD